MEWAPSEHGTAPRRAADDPLMRRGGPRGLPVMATTHPTAGVRTHSWGIPCKRHGEATDAACRGLPYGWVATLRSACLD